MIVQRRVLSWLVGCGAVALLGLPIGGMAAPTPYKIVTRGWLDVRNRYSLWDETPIAAGRTYTLSWDLQPQDHVFKAGHRIGVVLISTDRDHTLRYRTGTRIEAELGLSHVLLPLS